MDAGLEGGEGTGIKKGAGKSKLRKEGIILQRRRGGGCFDCTVYVTLSIYSPTLLYRTA